MSKFELLVTSLDSKIIDLTWTGELFKHEGFRKIYYDSEIYLKDALEALKNQDLSEQAKIITVLSMQNLSLANWLYFSKTALFFLESNLISASIFRWIIFQSYDWNTKFAENYLDPEVKELMLKFTKSNVVNEDIKKYVEEEIITGKARKTVILLRETGQIP